ncbi:unnamed protein product, partial [Pleuronectes platessa]
HEDESVLPISSGNGLGVCYRVTLTPEGLGAENTRLNQGHSWSWAFRSQGIILPRQTLTDPPVEPVQEPGPLKH